MKEAGIKRTEDGGVFCEKCGADLSADGSVKFTSHLDGTTFYENQYICTKCNAVITQTFERSSYDAEFWGDESEDEE